MNTTIGKGITVTGTIHAEESVIIAGTVRVPPENAPALLALPEVDGALVGGASLEFEPFEAICRAVAE